MITDSSTDYHEGTTLFIFEEKLMISDLMRSLEGKNALDFEIISFTEPSEYRGLKNSGSIVLRHKES